MTVVRVPASSANLGPGFDALGVALDVYALMGIVAESTDSEALMKRVDDHHPAWIAFDAAGGVQAWLAERGRGFRVREAVIPIVPGAICFDLLNGGNKAWGRFPPYRDLGYAAAQAASTDFALGSVGAGLGATTANLKGGLGSASAQTEGGITVGALAVVNAVGSVTVGDGPWFWAAPFEIGIEFGGQGLPPSFTPDMLKARLKGGPAATPG